MKRIVTVTAKLLLVVAVAAVLWVTNDLSLMVLGSDSTSFLVSPPVPLQLLCGAIFAIALLVPASGRWRIGLVSVAVAAVLLGGHRLVVDNLHDEIRDVYLAVPVQSLALDPANEGGLILKGAGLGFRIGQPGTGRTIWCLSPGKLGLDPAGLRILAELAPKAG